jgi:hypothetical protein
LKELFEGNRDVFVGLEAESRWDWSVRYPVLRFSFAGGVLGSVPAVHNSIEQQLSEQEQHWGLSVSSAEIRARFRTLLQHAHAASGQRVVILIDEYDKPILDRIEDRVQAMAIREVLKDFYSVIKDSDAHVRFAFLTGVSKFSKAGIFSGLNNLIDITVEPHFSAICGYTEHDLDTVFAPELIDQDRDEIRRWYNGYNWLGEAVYNPFDLLLFFRTKIFAPHWFSTGTPTFLIKLLMERHSFIPALTNLQVDVGLLSAFDVEHISTEALMWQTGYLTFGSAENLGGEMFYQLRYPNHEVYLSVHKSLAGALLGDVSKEANLRRSLWYVLKSRDPETWQRHFTSLFAAIPHDWHRKNEIAHYEGYYASVFYSHFAALGLDIRLEDATNLGRIDMTVLFDGAVFIFEFKVVEDNPQGHALEQIKTRNYAEKYRAQNQPIHLIGIEFSRQNSSVTGFAVEHL